MPVFNRLTKGAVAALAGAIALSIASVAAAAPASPEAMVALLRAAIADRDYDAVANVINWDGAGKIKKRIVAFEVRRGFGRPVKSIALEPVNQAAIAAGAAQMNSRLNMPVSHKIRIVFDEPPSAGSDSPPTAVYLVGQGDDGWHIALVVRDPAKFKDDD